MTTLKKIWSITTTVIVILMVLCAVFLMGSRLIGYECYNVISPSMEPEYSVGDLIYVKEVDPSTVKVGDVITFVVNEDLVVGTHRVVRIDNEKKQFITKGDTNDTEDAPVHFNNLIGVPKFSIPKLGYVSDFVQNPPGMYITLGLGLLLIALVFLPDIIKKKEKVVADPEKAPETTPEAAEKQAELNAISEENERLKAELERLRAEKSDEGAVEESIDEPSEKSK